MTDQLLENETAKGSDLQELKLKSKAKSSQNPIIDLKIAVGNRNQKTKKNLTSQSIGHAKTLL